VRQALRIQEAQRGPGRRECQLPQPLWCEGRQFLQEKLHGLKRDKDCNQARILGDCHCIDIYNRLLLDNCGVYNMETLPEEDGPFPTLQRIERAKRALCKAYGLFDKEILVSPESSFFSPLFLGGNDTGWKLLQMSGHDKVH